MTSRPRRTILLTGAPLRSSLDWSKDILTRSSPSRFTTGDQDADQIIPTAETVFPQWRSLSLNHEHLPTGLSPASCPTWNTPNCFGSTQASYLTAEDLSALSSEAGYSSPQAQADALTQYYEHSFATHDAACSEFVGDASVAPTMTDASDDSALQSTRIDEEHSRVKLLYLKLSQGHISSLNNVPNAAYLSSISPQTITINLVLAIISISQPRVIKTRKWQRTVELVELLVGDETSAGFGINIWLDPRESQDNLGPVNAGDATLRVQTQSLRPRDIVLARNVALGSFRGKVYGQSLRRGVTMVDLLCRDVMDTGDTGGAFKAREIYRDMTEGPRLGKLGRVKEWMTNFVGGRVIAPNGIARTSPSSLPQDTQ